MRNYLHASGLSLILITYLISSLRVSTAADTLGANQTLSSNQTLVSQGRTFEAGFYNTSANRWYFGIWFMNITRTVVWIANRNDPLTDSSGVLTIDKGIVVLLNGSHSVIWSSRLSVVRPVVQLLDTGNLVLKGGVVDRNSTSVLWQSFDHPCDTALPTMKQGWDLVTGLNRELTSWKNFEDPAPGLYTYGLELADQLPQFVLRNQSRKQFRTGPWNGLRFSGLPNFQSDGLLNGTFVSNADEVYFVDDGSSSVRTRFSVDAWGKLQYHRWDVQALQWTLMFQIPKDQCDNYNQCGANGLCDIHTSPFCNCLRGFVPKSQQQWDTLCWIDGCIRKTPLGCGDGDIFVPLKGVKLPDTINSWVNSTTGLEECEVECRRSCSCAAYAYANISKVDSRCILWYDNLLDVRRITDDDEQIIYMRLAASEQGNDETTRTTSMKKNKVLMTTLLSVGSSVLLFALIICSVIWKRRRNGEGAHNEEMQKEEFELPLFDLITIETATNNFCHTNKIGEGGFGSVYKGKLTGGEEIAVKRLSKNSGQGLCEFRNEVILIAKLQHRNLVRLLGCCIQGNERMLVYEYMPNESLDYFIFDEKKSKLLNWSKRWDIVMGIARGLLYLHQDSRLRIIHRDLKAGNILLDINMNPKISDFGMARLFRGDQTDAKTERVVGTYGYMSPEYAIDGHFSTKSDVFSFGVLVLEVVSGKKNKGFYNDNHHHTLLGHAWMLWRDGNIWQFMDPSLEISSSASSEVLKCIQVGLLCVQQLPEDRPSMSSAVFMLGSENVVLPEPKQPGFFVERSCNDTRASGSSENHVTFSVFEGR